MSYANLIMLIASIPKIKIEKDENIPEIDISSRKSLKGILE